MVIIPNYSVKQVYKLEIWIAIISHRNSQLFSPVFLSFYVTLFLVFLFFVLHFFFWLWYQCSKIYISFMLWFWWIKCTHNDCLVFLFFFLHIFFHWCQCSKSNISLMLRFWSIKRSQKKNSFFVSPIKKFFISPLIFFMWLILFFLKLLWHCLCFFIFFIILFKFMDGS